MLKHGLYPASHGILRSHFPQRLLAAQTLRQFVTQMGLLLDKSMIRLHGIPLDTSPMHASRVSKLVHKFLLTANQVG